MIIGSTLLYIKVLHQQLELIERLCNPVMIGNFIGSKLSKAHANFKENKMLLFGGKGSLKVMEFLTFNYNYVIQC